MGNILLAYIFGMIIVLTSALVAMPYFRRNYELRMLEKTWRMPAFETKG